MTGLAHLDDIIVLLAAAVVVMPLVQRLHVSPVLGYLAAGLAIGPFGLGLFGDTDGISDLAEFGVVFLLFTIGLELSPQRLWTMRRYVFGLGLAQVAATSAAIGVIAWSLGLPAPAARPNCCWSPSCCRW